MGGATSSRAAERVHGLIALQQLAAALTASAPSAGISRYAALRVEAAAGGCDPAATTRDIDEHHCLDEIWASFVELARLCPRQAAWPAPESACWTPLFNALVQRGLVDVQDASDLRSPANPELVPWASILLNCCDGIASVSDARRAAEWVCAWTLLDGVHPLYSYVDDDEIALAVATTIATGRRIRAAGVEALTAADLRFAVDLLERLISGRPGQPELHLLKSDVLFHLGERDESAAISQWLMESTPADHGVARELRFRAVRRTWVSDPQAAKAALRSLVGTADMCGDRRMGLIAATLTATLASAAGDSDAAEWISEVEERSRLSGDRLASLSTADHWNLLFKGHYAQAVMRATPAADVASDTLSFWEPHFLVFDAALHAFRMDLPPGEAARRAETAQRLAESRGDDWNRALALTIRGLCEGTAGDVERAEESLGAASAYWLAISDSSRAAWVECCRAIIAYEQHDLSDAARLASGAAAAFAHAGDTNGRLRAEALLLRVAPEDGLVERLRHEAQVHDHRHLMTEVLLHDLRRGGSASLLRSHQSSHGDDFDAGQRVLVSEYLDGSGVN